jgi:DNA segregation ATPase FtsK/SpoIIIE, S-DNA-T family
MAKRRKRRTLKPRTPSRVKRRKRARGHQHPELTGLGLVAVGIFLAVVLYLGWDGGQVGGWIADGLRSLVGSAAYVLPIGAVVLGGLMVARSELVDLRPFRTGVLIASLGLLLVLGSEWGGHAGDGLESVVARLLGDTGSLILGCTALVFGGLLITGASLGALLRHSGSAVRRAGTAARRSLDRQERPAAQRPVRVSEPVEEVWGNREVSPALSARPDHRPVDAVSAFPDVVGGSPPQLVAAPEVEPSQEQLFEPEPSTSGGRGVYRLPERGLLRSSPRAPVTNAQAGAQVAEALVQALAHFGIDATVVGEIAGPRVTRYELRLAPGTKMSKVSALKDDLSYALATTEIRILAPIPGKQAVGVEVPNLSPNLVTLGDIYDDLPSSSSPLAVWLGKDISGNAVWTDLARMPHILIAGTTGSGKSGSVNAMLTSILLRTTPDDVRMILIDPKRIELSYYERIPHLLTPVVSSPKEAAAVLTNVVAEMERRYERLSVVRARNLPEANRAFRSRGEQTLPYLLVVIDELADLMMVSPQAVEDAVIRLAQKSRAVGIHLVLATQRPSVDVITGMIKANVPSRIAFAVSSQTDSRVILDQAGAESLLGQGDMLFKPLGTSRLQRLQGAYVSEEEIALIVDQCRDQREQELDESLLEAPEAPVDAGDAGDDDFDPDQDPLLDRAIEIVVQTQTASVSLIQRRLRVGYTRAGRLIDMLERRGIISGYEGSKPRRVLLTEADLERVATP